LQLRIIPGLHALRGLAAMMIVIFHIKWIHQLSLPSELGFIKSLFGMGVPIFFVVSSFSLYLSTLNNVRKKGWLKFYFIKRFFRIAPLFYVMLVMYLVYFFIAFGQTFHFFDVLLNFSFLFNLFPEMHKSIVWAGWAVGVEWMFYAILPLFLIYINSLPKAILLFGVCAAFSWGGRVLLNNLDIGDSYTYKSIISQLGIFAVGIPSYFAYRYFQERKIETLVKFLLPSIFLFLLVVLVKFSSQIMYWVGGTHVIQLWAISFGVLVLSQVVCPNILITNRVTVFLGELSFSLYLVHPMLIYQQR